MEPKKHLQTLFLTTFFILLSVLNTHAQQIYASSASEVSLGNHVDNTGNAAAANGKFATIRSYGGVSAGIGAYSGELKLEFTGLVPANTTTYIKVDGGNNGLFDSLLGGSLGALLSNEAGTLAIGDHYVEVKAFDDSGIIVASGRTDNLTSSKTLKIVRNKDGDVFIAISPKAAYRSLVVQDITNALLLGTENFTNVYHAFYINSMPIICNPEGTFTSYDGTGITLDLLNLGATGVNNPEFAIDRNDTTYSTISVGVVSALASIYQDIQFLTTASDKDQLEINIGTQEGSLLNLALLQNINIELYKKEIVVYSTSADAANTITIQPSTAGDIHKIIINSGIEFDRLRLTLSSPAGVNLAQQINLFSTKIAITPPTISEGAENQTFCTSDIPKVSDLIASATGTLVWYQQTSGGSPYTMTDTLVDGVTYYASNVNGSCESSPRLPVFVSLQDLTPPAGSSLQSFCKVKRAIIANLEVSAFGVVTWYDRAIGGNSYTSKDYLVHGQQYYASNSDGTCESSIRLKVAVTITNINAPEGDPSQSFCSENTPTINDLEASASGTIIWYDQENDGNRYAASDPLENGVRYYAANSDATCESSERLTVIVTIQNPLTPTSETPEQLFCATDSPTIKSLEAKASGIIIWYDLAIDGEAYDDTTSLINGLKYYAANLEGTCESKSRLEIIVSITDPEIPKGNRLQNFCNENDPSIIDLEATGNGTIIWYNQVKDGVLYDPNIALIDGLKYYAAQSDGTCESTKRLEVLVTISDFDAPTGNALQSFCSENTPTINDLEASASGTIIWYDQENDGNRYAMDTSLIHGVPYYAANSDGTCESSNRLEVTAAVMDLSTPTGENTQEFCAYKNSKISDLNATATNTVIWYDQSTDGNTYDAATLLIDGLKYYGANSDGNCESAKRLTVTVAINNTSTPRTNNENQSFCEIDAPKIADLDATANGTVIWYDQDTDGNAYSANALLVDGLQYYAANSDGTCESSDRLAVTAFVTDSNAPEGNSSQNFCSEEMPTIKDLEASATGTIIWYNQEKSGNIYSTDTPLKQGFSYYGANLASPCESSTRLKVTVILKKNVDIKIQGNTAEICFGTREIYQAPIGYAPYAWSIVGGKIISGGTNADNAIEVEWNNLIDTTISVALTGGCFNTNMAEQAVEIVTCSDLTIQKEVDIIKPTFGDTVTFTIQVENSSLSVFTDIQIFELLSNGFIYISKSATLGTYNENSGVWNMPSLGANQSATLTIEAEVHTTGSYLNTVQIINSVPIDANTSNNTAKILVTPLCLKVYNTITPNGDGMNDYFIISCIENFPNTMIEIFDRYGSIVYKKKNYKNDWNGVANQTSKIIKTGEKLPNGTYFFILKMNDTNIKDKKSYIQIIK